MKLDTLLQAFLPKDKKFFPLFEKATANLVNTAKVMNEMVNSPLEKRKEFIKKIEDLEHVGDSITHEIMFELSSTFITPFDREDIHELATAIDDIVDYIHGSAKRIDIYKVHEINSSIVKLTELIQKGAEELNHAVMQLRSMKNIDKIKEACVRINSIENHADDIFDNAIGLLFENEKDAIQLIKIKEILSVLEMATDKCEDAANVIQSLIVKTT